MAPFPLHQLPLLPLQRVITKLEFKSYCRLQQTCRALGEVIRTNPNIRSVCMEEDRNKYSIVIGEMNSDGSIAAYKENTAIHLSSTHGIRFNKVQCILWRIEHFCGILKKYRITCEYLRLHSFTVLEKEQYDIIFSSLKPIELELDIGFESVFQTRTLKHVIAKPLGDPDTAINVAQKLLRRFEKVEMEVNIAGSTRPPKLHNLLQPLLQFLTTESLPNLNRFELLYRYTFTMAPSRNELLLEYRDFQPIIEEEIVENNFCENSVNMAISVKSNYICHVHVGNCSTVITYKENGEEITNCAERFQNFGF